MGETGLGLLGNDAERGPVRGLLQNRRVLVVGALLVVGLLLGIGFAFRSHKAASAEKIYPMVFLYENLSDEQTTRVTQELSFLNVKFETKKTGKLSTVSVPENKVDFALQHLAQKGLPLGGAPGFELFDKDDGLGATEFDKRIKYIRAVSGEIERSIARLEQVKLAKVQIVIPEKKLFAINQDPVKASVMIELQTGKKLSPDQIYGIIQLTCHSVEGLLAKDVSVVDNYSNVLSQGVIEEAYRKQLDQESQSGIISKTPPLSLPNSEMLDKTGEATVAKAPIPKQTDTDWLKSKEGFEGHLKRKVSESLSLLLPPESFQIEIDAQFRSMENNVPVIDRVVCSLMLDSSDERIFLDDIEKKKIFAAVSDAIAYKSGRDQIVLRRVNFRQGAAVSATAGPVKALVKTTKQAPKALIFKALHLASVIPWRLVWGLAVLGISGILIWRWRRRRSAASSTSLDENDETNDEDLPEPVPVEPLRELSLQEVLAKHQNDITQLQALAGDDPDALAALLRTWLDQPDTDLKAA